MNHIQGLTNQFANFACGHTLIKPSWNILESFFALQQKSIDIIWKGISEIWKNSSCDAVIACLSMDTSVGQIPLCPTSYCAQAGSRIMGFCSYDHVRTHETLKWVMPIKKIEKRKKTRAQIISTLTDDIKPQIKLTKGVWSSLISLYVPLAQPGDQIETISIDLAHQIHNLSPSPPPLILLFDNIDLNISSILSGYEFCVTTTLLKNLVVQPM